MAFIDLSTVESICSTALVMWQHKFKIRALHVLLFEFRSFISYLRIRFALATTLVFDGLWYFCFYSGIFFPATCAPFVFVATTVLCFIFAFHDIRNKNQNVYLRWFTIPA